MKFRIKHVLSVGLIGPALIFGAISAVKAQTPHENALGRDVKGLLDYAKQKNPEYATMRLEADAASERILPAGALPDPKLRVELMDITKMGDQNPTLSPSRVGSTRYRIMQDVPWFGKRDLKREIAELEAEGAKGRAIGTWAELSMRIKTGYAQLYYLHRSDRLGKEILDLMVRLEKVAQVRYASGLVPQQDVIRAQVEQTTMRNELVMIENEVRQNQARMNALLARPAHSTLAEPAFLRPLPAAIKLEYATLADRIRVRNPQIFTEDARLKAAEKNRDLTYKNRYPDFSFGIEPTQAGRSVKEWGVMVEMNIPLQQSSRRSQERESEAMLSAARARKESTANLVLAELSGSLSALDAARQTEMLTQNSLLPQAELTFQSALAGYQNGKVDFATLLDAQKQIKQARQNLIKAQAEMQMRLAEIERLLGDEL